MEKQSNLYRHELKYFINKRQAAELSLFLNKSMHLDPNSNETGSYWIRSLYFDTINNRDYYEKIIGHSSRKKIRLRIYDTSATAIKLEIKNKLNNYIHKETVIITREDAKKFIHGDCNFLLCYNEIAANKIYAFMHRNLYRPTVVIDYNREAYFYPFQNIRITIDKNLRSASGSFNLFNEDTCLIPVFNNNVFVLEVKYEHMIPVFLQRALSSFVLPKSQISKYCLGRNILGK